MASEPLPTAPIPPPVQEIGTTGLRRSYGYVLEEYLPELSGAAGIEVYRRMASDPVVGGLLFAFETLVRQVGWTVVPVDDSPAAGEAKDFVESLMGDMEHSWSAMLGEIATMFQYGFAPLELVLKQRRGPDEKDGALRSKFTDNRYGVRKLSLRAQHTIDRWAIDDFGTIHGLWQNRFEVGLPQVFIPDDRIINFRTKAVAGNPLGHSILRSAYKPWWMRCKVEQIEIIGIERDLAGLPIYRLPSRHIHGGGAEQAKNMAEAVALVTNVRRDMQEGLVLPSDRDEHGNPYYEFQLLSASGSRTLNIDATINRYDARILMCVLADFMMLGSGTKAGSWALSSDKTELFTLALGVFVKSIEDDLNRFLVPRIWAINGMDRDVMPKFKAGDIEPVNLDALGRFVTALAGAGAPLFPDDALENDLRAKGGMPPVADDRLEMQREIAVANTPPALLGAVDTGGGGAEPPANGIDPAKEPKPANSDMPPRQAVRKAGEHPEDVADFRARLGELLVGLASRSSAS